MGSVRTVLPRLMLMCATALAACSTEASIPPTTAPGTFDAAVVVIEPGFHPKMRPDQVAGIVLRQISAMERTAGKAVAAPRIVRMTATSAAGVSRLEPNAGVPEAPPGGTRWLVRAEGTFMSNRGPVSGASGVAGTGFLIIDDANGEILGFGYP
jgi:hypothetical protein